MRTYLDFEKPVAELETKLECLEEEDLHASLVRLGRGVLSRAEKRKSRL